MSPVTRYRRVRVRVWTEAAFRQFDEGAKLVALYLLSGPQTNSIGLYRLSIGGAAEDLAMPLKPFRQRLASVVEAFGWRHEAESGLLWIPGWAEENAPANDNVCKSWAAAFNELSESPLKTEAVAAAIAFLKTRKEKFAEAFLEVLQESIPERSRNRSVNAPVSDQEWPNRLGNDERRLVNAESTRGMVDRLRSRGFGS